MKANFDKGTKICSKCKRELPIENFQKNSYSSDGFTCRCKECLSHKNMTDEEKERRKQIHKKYRLSEKGEESRKRQNERKRNDPEYKEKNRQKSHEYYHKNLAHPKKLKEIEIDENGNEVFECTTCRRKLPIEMFPKDNTNRLGIHFSCKDCYNAYRREKSHTEECREKNRKKMAKFRNSEKGKEYFSEYRKSESFKQSSKKYRESEHGKETKRQYRKRLWNESPEYKLETALRNRVRLAIKNGSKAASTIELVGCSVQDLKKHIESQFCEGMSWDNYNHKTWHIDHIVPCSAFDLTNPIHQRVCFNWMNLQPLWSKLNIKKKDRLTEGSQELVDFIRDELGIKEEIVLKDVEKNR